MSYIVGAKLQFLIFIIALRILSSTGSLIIAHAQQKFDGTVNVDYPHQKVPTLIHTTAI